MVDEAVIDLMQWVEAKAAEREIGKVDGPQPDPKKKQGWVPKYASIGDILAEYDGREPDAPPVDDTEVADLIAAMDAQAVPAF